MRLQLADGNRLTPYRSFAEGEPSAAANAFQNVLEFLKKPETQSAISKGATTAVGLVQKKKPVVSSTPKMLPTLIQTAASAVDEEKIALRVRVDELTKENSSLKNQRIYTGLAGFALGIAGTMFLKR
jgi:hypothetical protein